jgi:hypothetical protein
VWVKWRGERVVIRKLSRNALGRSSSRHFAQAFTNTGQQGCDGIGAVKPAYRKVNPRLPVPIDLGDERIAVAVGTTIADRPPYRTVRAFILCTAINRLSSSMLLFALFFGGCRWNAVPTALPFRFQVRGNPKIRGSPQQRLRTWAAADCSLSVAYAPPDPTGTHHAFLYFSCIYRSSPPLIEPQFRFRF